MRRVPLALAAAAAAIVLVPTIVGRLEMRRRSPTDLRDSLGAQDWPDLARIHAPLAGPGDSCALCHDDRRETLSGSRSASSRPLAASSVCLSCHDGTLTRRMSAHLAARRPGEPGTEASNGHPIGMELEAARRRRPADFNDPRGGGVTLEHGLVGCASCHVGHAGAGRRAGPAATAPDSCLACHNM